LEERAIQKEEKDEEREMEGCQKEEESSRD
jgi:hypothetical protein